MILVVGQNTAWQKVCILTRLTRGEVNRAERVHAYPSGKGPNAARALACMGKDAVVLGYAGGRTGELLTEGLRREGINAHFTLIRDETRTCTTIAEPDGAATEIIEPSPEVTPAERKLFLTTFHKHIGDARMLFICGTTVRGEAEDCYSVLVNAARGRGITVLLDSSCPAAVRALEESPEILKVNIGELSEIAGRPLPDAGARMEEYARLAGRFGIRRFFTTMGAEGIEGFDGTRLLHASPPKVRVINAIGSGDAASAGLGIAFEEKLDFEKALLTAAAMGTANCLNEMNGRVERKEYLEVLMRVTVREIFG